METRRLVCTCMDVYEDEIIDAINKYNLTTIEGIGDKTDAGTVCGGCHKDLDYLLQDHASSHEKNPQNEGSESISQQ